MSKPPVTTMSGTSNDAWAYMYSCSFSSSVNRIRVMTCMSRLSGDILLSISLSCALHAQHDELHGKALSSEWLCERVSES